jgi:predicted  nucleic acid-binding Zn-ribbon protein
MTERERATLSLFEQRLRLLVDKHQKALLHIKELTDTLEQNNRRIQELEERCATLEQNYNNLKQAKVISLSDAKIGTTRERLTALVREIDRCIESLTK